MSTALMKELQQLTGPHIADGCLRSGTPIRFAPTEVKALTPDMECRGRALPVRHVGSIDIFFEALEHSRPGDVIVIDNGGRTDEACIGDIVLLEAKAAGIAGFVIWGLHRDSKELREIGFPVFSMGALPTGPQRLHVRPPDALERATFGQHVITNKDVVVADANGVLFLSEDRLPDVVAAAAAYRDTEARQLKAMREGRTYREQTKFDQYLRKRKEQPAYGFRQHLKDIEAAGEVLMAIKKGQIHVANAIRFQRTGGPEVLELEQVEVGAPQDGFAVVRHTAIGVNYIDTYHRSGLYPVALPSGLGVEGVGVVEAVGPGVKHVAVGDRVAYAGGTPGSYADRRVMSAANLVRLPDGLADVDAAATLLQGMTVYSLIHRVYKVQPGQTVLWHAAAGGVGLIACQWLRSLGVTVIGTVSTEEKAEVARANGCAHTILYSRDNFADRVKELTNGKGVPVVFDSVGKSTWEGSLQCLQRLGLMVSFGNASGAVEPINVGQLAARGSLYLTRPVLGDYVGSRTELEQAAGALFKVLSSGDVKANIHASYALRDAGQAHVALQSRGTRGAVVLVP